jgi:hypothetical protein
VDQFKKLLENRKKLRRESELLADRLKETRKQTETLAERIARREFSSSQLAFAAECQLE